MSSKAHTDQRYGYPSTHYHCIGRATSLLLYLRYNVQWTISRILFQHLRLTQIQFAINLLWGSHWQPSVNICSGGVYKNKGPVNAEDMCGHALILYTYCVSGSGEGLEIGAWR